MFVPFFNASVDKEINKKAYKLEVRGFKDLSAGIPETDRAVEEVKGNRSDAPLFSAPTPTSLSCSITAVWRVAASSYLTFF